MIPILFGRSYCTFHLISSDEINKWVVHLLVLMGERVGGRVGGWVGGLMKIDAKELKTR